MPALLEYTRSDVRRFSEGAGGGLRHFVSCLCSPGFNALMVYRVFSWLRLRNIPAQPLRFFVERIVEITTGISIPASCVIGKGARIHHFGGIVIHPSTVIGENVTIYQGVTIGDKGGHGKAAVIGNNVLLGAGCKIIGEVRIGNDCAIGANAVVTRDVPDGCTVRVECVVTEPRNQVSPNAEME